MHDHDDRRALTRDFLQQSHHLTVNTIEENEKKIAGRFDVSAGRGILIGGEP